MKIAIVGATGLVGRKMIEKIENSQLPVKEIIPIASLKSYGKKITFKGKDFFVKSLEEGLKEKPNIALFSAGSDLSLEYAPKFAETGTFVIDNSSAWRMNDKIKLIVPEINAEILTADDKIIANPNCSTIQLVMALAPLHKKYEIKRVIISTYQSVSGSGQKAIMQLKNERAGIDTDYMFYPYKIDLNVLPHCDVFLENGYTKEEMKLVNETRKILDDKKIQLSATAVRVPVIGGHSESVNIEFNKIPLVSEIKEILNNTKGIIVMDNPFENIYPTPQYSFEKDEIFVGRIREDISNKNAINMWIVADNIRKGAATNAVQIAEYILKFI